MNHRLRLWLTLYQLAAGFCDTSTGVLLIAAPAFTLGVMGLTILPQPVAFVRYIGVFVLSVGLTYLWAVLRWPLNEHAVLVWSTQWKITALVRLLVALFVLWQVATGAMEPRWITVAFSDGVFAAIQIMGLAKGWLESAA
jgi:hypothetical protein